MAARAKALAGKVKAGDKAASVTMSIVTGNRNIAARKYPSTWGAALLVVAALTCSVASCGEDTESVREKPPYPAIEPKFVLANVALAFENANPAILRQNLNGGFAFYFGAGDVGAELTTGYVIPASWDRTEFLHAAEKLIESAQSASLKFPWDKVGSPEPGAAEYEAEIGLVFVVIQDASRDYRAAGPCRFSFLKSSGGMWELAAWRDYTSVTDLGAGAASLGRILALYYE